MISKDSGSGDDAYRLDKRQINEIDKFAVRQNLREMITMVFTHAKEVEGTCNI